MPWSDAVLRSLVIPQDAGDTDPRIEIGVDDTNPVNGPAAIRYLSGVPGVVIADEVGHTGTRTDLGRTLYVPAPGSNVFLDVLTHTPEDGVVRREWAAANTGPGYGYAQIVLDSGDAGDSLAHHIAKTVRLDAFDTVEVGTNVTVKVTVTAPSIVLAGDVTYAGQSLPRGIVMDASEVTTSGVMGTSETLILTSPVKTYAKNRAYRIRFSGGFQPSAAAYVQFRVRKGTVLGQLLRDTGHIANNVAGAVVAAEFSGMFTTGNADVTTALALGGFVQSGTATLFGATGGAQREFYVEDIGASSRIDATKYPVLV